MLRRTPLTRSTGLRYRSRKTEALYRRRRPLVARLLEERPVCEWPAGCANRSTDPHEVVLRSQGGSVLDETNILMLCRQHHAYAHDHPLEARSLGVLKPRWSA